MGQSFTVNLDVAGQSIHGVLLNWGLIAGDARTSAPSYGVDIEVPAVIGLLDLVISGAVTASEARESLNRVAVDINERMDRLYDQYLESDERAERLSAETSVTAPRLDSRWVYAVSSEADTHAVKIGVATDIDKRLKSLQMGSASPIVLRWKSRGGYPLERHLHRVFDEQRISGEWFRFTKFVAPVATISKAAEEFLEQYGAAAHDEPSAS